MLFRDIPPLAILLFDSLLFLFCIDFLFSLSLFDLFLFVIALLIGVWVGYRHLPTAEEAELAQRKEDADLEDENVSKRKMWSPFYGTLIGVLIPILVVIGLFASGLWTFDGDGGVEVPWGSFFADLFFGFMSGSTFGNAQKEKKEGAIRLQ